jgi:hypothetical protein
MAGPTELSVRQGDMDRDGEADTLRGLVCTRRAVVRVSTMVRSLREVITIAVRAFAAAPGLRDAWPIRVRDVEARTASIVTLTTTDGGGRRGPGTEDETRAWTARRLTLTMTAT